MKFRPRSALILISLLVVAAGCGDDPAPGRDSAATPDAGDGGAADRATTDAGDGAAGDAARDAAGEASTTTDGMTPTSDAQLDQAPRNVFRPADRPFSEARLAQLRLPSGFRIQAFAQNLGNPRMLAVGPDGSVYVTRRDQGVVTRLRDTNADGVADQNTAALSGIEGVHGITIHMGKVYLANVKTVQVSALAGDGSLGTPTVIINNLPDGGQHPNRTLAVGGDGKLYITVGSTCDACEEPNPEHATVLQTNLDGSGRRVYARGLRNTLGFGWHPMTGKMWGADHGSDWRGNDEPPDEINEITDGGNYGWPFCHGKKQIDQVIMPPKMMTKEAYCAMTLPSAFELTAHSAPIGMVFYTGTMFPAEYRNDAFVALRGSWNRYPPTGYKVVRVRFQNGQPSALEDLVSGFLIEDGNAHFGRLAGLAVGADGSLFVAEDTNGVVYRVSYAGAGGGADGGATDGGAAGGG
jgi:glucose/arabinose dehydrogenase